MIKQKELNILFNYKKAQNYFRRPTVQKNVIIKKDGLDKYELIIFLKRFHYNNDKINKIIWKGNRKQKNKRISFYFKLNKAKKVFLNLYT